MKDAGRKDAGRIVPLPGALVFLGRALGDGTAGFRRQNLFPHGRRFIGFFPAQIDEICPVGGGDSGLQGHGQKQSACVGIAQHPFRFYFIKIDMFQNFDEPFAAPGRKDEVDRIVFHHFHPFRGPFFGARRLCLFLRLYRLPENDPVAPFFHPFLRFAQQGMKLGFNPA